jgi:hypothetical protein
MKKQKMLLCQISDPVGCWVTLSERAKHEYPLTGFASLIQRERHLVGRVIRYMPTPWPEIPLVEICWVPRSGLQCHEFRSNFLTGELEVVEL